MRILVTGRAIPSQPDRCTGQRLVEGFKQAGHEAYFYGSFCGDWMNFLGSEECQDMPSWDLVVVTEMNDGGPGYEPLFEYYKLADVPKLYWDFDVSYNEAYGFQRAGGYKYDGYLVGNKLYLDRFRERFGKPVLHLAYACSPQWEKSLDTQSQRPYLVGFIGSLTDERKRLMDIVSRTAIDSASILLTNGVFGDDLIAETNKMCAMFHCNQDACHGLVPGRPWETAACGTTLMMDRKSYEDFAEFLPDHVREDLLVYDDDDSLRSLVALWQHKPRELQLMGESLGTYIRENHSYKQRAEAIIEFVKDEGLGDG